MPDLPLCADAQFLFDPAAHFPGIGSCQFHFHRLSRSFLRRDFHGELRLFVRYICRRLRFYDGEKFRIVGYSYADFLGDMKVEPTRIGVKEGAK